MANVSSQAAAAEVWTVRKVLGWTAQHFENRRVDSPRLTAEVLLAHILRTTRVRLYTDLDRPLDANELGAFRALIRRRVEGEPTQYLTGQREFYNRAFAVDSRVLIPRPETELLVELALRHLPKDVPSRVADLCTGSGCVAISVAAERPLCEVIATDISADACDVARLNAEALGVAARVRVVQADLLAPVVSERELDVIAANPPYVATDEIARLSVEVQREPRLALDGGPDGLSFIRRVIRDAREHLKVGGLLALEIGDEQGPAVLALLEEAGYASARVEKDLARHDRLAFGSRPPQSE